MSLHESDWDKFSAERMERGGMHRQTAPCANGDKTGREGQLLMEANTESGYREIMGEFVLPLAVLCAKLQVQVLM